MNTEEISKLKSYFAKKPICLVYLFGSKATGRGKPYSDIDIAVLFSEKLSGQERFDLKLKILSDISLILKTDAIDIVDLSTASSFLKYEAIKNRQEIFVKSESKRVDFETQVLSEYFDMQYYLKRHIEKGFMDLKKDYGVKTG